MDKAGKELATEYNISDPEDIERLKNSIHLLSEWMGRGMEIYAAVESPSETKAVFPSIEKQSLSTSFLSLISDKGSEISQDS